MNNDYTSTRKYKFQEVVNKATGEILQIYRGQSLLREALRLGATIESVENEQSAPVEGAVSYGFSILTDNVHKAKNYDFNEDELEDTDKFIQYIGELSDKRILLENLIDASNKIIRPADASRYFPKGQKRIKARIYKKLGRWRNCPALLLTLTFAPALISRQDAWYEVGYRVREFMNKVNQWRGRNGFSKKPLHFLKVLEVQRGKNGGLDTEYPHVHIVFPYLKSFLAPISVLNEIWGQGNNAVDVKCKDNMSPVSYVCKYITKLDDWGYFALSQIWLNKTRLYSMSRDYVLPDYSDKRVPEWQYRGIFYNPSDESYIKYFAQYDTS